MTAPAWTPVAAAAEVTTTPRTVRAGGQDWTAVRLDADGPVRLLAAHCPHRLVPLAAATVEGGRLRCGYHGWEWDGDGRCVLVPSLGADARVPPRASLPAPPPVRERDGVVEALLLPADERPGVDGLGNEDPRLRAAWHPLALSAEVGAEPVAVRLLGDAYVLVRTAAGLACEPPVAGLVERWGVVLAAPDPPAVPLFDDPDAEDAAHVGRWLPPVRTPAPAGFVADNFLDVAHFPFVHAGTFGAAGSPCVAPYDVEAEPGGLRSVQLQDFDNPEDPGVLAGVRPVRQRRRATYVLRAPFQLLLRLEELDAGAVKTILFLVQPESARSTRVYTRMMLRGIGGVERPDEQVLAAECAFEERVLAEDLALQGWLTLPVLPLDVRDELHVRADRLGVALRRTLAELVGA